MGQIDPRLAALYDIDNPDGPDHDHWRRQADRIDARTIVDLGCGTGLLTVTLATGGRSVIGIDPDATMLDVARHRQGGHRVTWIEGDASAIAPSSADLVLMTGNVAQHIGPRDWRRALDDIANGLRAGGTLAFESRNPGAEAWRSWQAAEERHTRMTPSGPLTEWMEVTDPDREGTVILTAHNLFVDTGEQVTVVQPLTFRSQEQIVDDLDGAGLTTIAVRGGWHDEPIEPMSPLLAFEATNRRMGGA